MTRPIVVLELAGEHQLARDLVAGGVFVPGCKLALNEDCDLVLRGSDAQLSIQAMCVWVDGDRGAGLQLIGCDADMKQQIAALAQGADLGTATDISIAAAPDAHTDDELGTELLPAALDDINVGDATEVTAYDGAADRADGLDGPTEEEPGDGPVAGESIEEAGTRERKAANMHERLRHLTMAQQIKLANAGEVSERIVLERMYGKNVWEALLRNQRITGPEVARIARMGALPRTLMEIIIANGGWLQIPEVRRALLSNPRLGTDQIMRVLRLLPKHELKLAAVQSAYPNSVREAAKRLLKENA